MFSLLTHNYTLAPYCLVCHMHTFVAMHSPSTGPQSPTGLKVAVTGNDTAVVSWDAQQSRVCDDVIRNYSVRYQLRSGMGAIYTVYSSNASVTLQGLAHGAEYTVSVAAINSKGEISSFSALVQFTVTPTASPSSKLHPRSVICHPYTRCPPTLWHMLCSQPQSELVIVLLCICCSRAWY